ncbi:hypothetical protein [Shewanella algae]|uniref:hypothetical protein n=1 Tax=Shewanella algae TaxID=38313 RepID=UPI00399A986A
MEQIIGIDLAKRVFQVNIVSAQGEKKANKMITREKLTAFIVQQPPSRIVMEACGSANYWSRQFRQYGHEVKQISPQYVAPFRMGSKNDNTTNIGQPYLFDVSPSLDYTTNTGQPYLFDVSPSLD